MNINRIRVRRAVTASLVAHTLVTMPTEKGTQIAQSMWAEALEATGVLPTHGPATIMPDYY